ncbi:MAG: cupin domain-containing protein, partial [Bilophila sp.]
EGGFYAETYRSAGTIPHSVLPKEYRGDRAFSTAILFLLRQGEYSHLHRIRQDEIWHFHMGGPLRLVSLSPEGEARETLLGTDLARGQQVQSVVRGGCWFGATPAPGVDFALVGCTVAPGFDFADFEMGERHQLEQTFPAAHTLVREFTTK